MSAKKIPIIEKMKSKILKCAAVSFCAAFLIFDAAAQKKTYNPNAPISSKSSVNWIEKTFNSTISLDVEKANIPMPSGKNSATNSINSRLANLIKDPLLSIYVDSSHTLADYILEHYITLEDVIKVVHAGNKSLGFFDNETFLFKVKHNMGLPNLASLFVRHNTPYSRRKSIETISSRAYTGIIIDARGRLPVHGEFIQERANPCFFPKIWNENMDIVYERNMMDSVTEKKIGECAYDWRDDESLYRDRIGADPLHIEAQRVFGRNRTDLVISNEDTLKIFSIPKNAELIKQGKIVILLDRDVLIRDMTAPVKDEPYYTAYRGAKEYPLKNPGPDKIEDGPGGIRFVYNLKFIPDSPALLKEEIPRIAELAAMLEDALSKNSFTIFVGGHTADIGQHENQMKLSVERTQTVINLLAAQGLNKELFSYKGFGETQPVGDNSTPEGRAQNRRVEITLQPRDTDTQYSW